MHALFLRFGRAWFLPLLLLSGLLLNCTPDPIEIELPDHTPKLVISSVFGAIHDTTLGVDDSVLLVTVSRSFSALEGGEPGNTQDSTLVRQQLVLHARVELSGGNQQFILRPIGDGVYWLPHPDLLSDVPYTLTVSDSATQLRCQAAATFLPQMRFDYVRPVVTRLPTDTTVRLQYQLTDKPGPSYYMVQFTPLSAQQGSGARDVKNVGSLLETLQAQQRLRLLTDADFRNGRFTLDEKLAVSGQDTLLLGVAQISEGYYRFLQAYQRSGKLFNQLTGEPINYPTNVENGYGYFNLHSLTAVPLDLNEY